jgi:hypothetical protein
VVRTTLNKESKNCLSLFHADALGWLTVIAIAVGVFLRLYMIYDQVLLDDEWHSLHYVIGKPFGYLLTHFSIPGATSIPLNVYNLALLKTIGWSELMLRLPSIAAGILALFLFPILVRPVMERRPALLFMMLLAISPFLVFYSRVARPYSLFAAFGFASLMFGYNWLVSGRRAHRLAYLLTGALAVECHLLALPTVVAPLFIGVIFKLHQRRNRISLPRQVSPTWSGLAISGSVLAAVVGVLQLPAFLETLRTTMHVVAGQDFIKPESAWNAVCLLSGTANPVLAIVFMGLLLDGLWVLYRKNALAASLFVAVFVSTLSLLAVSQPEYIHAAIVLARYSIILFPICYVLVATGLDDGVERLLQMLQIRHLAAVGMIRSILPGCFVMALFITGPWWQIYAQSNNFTNHSAFQYSYKSIAWDRTYRSEMLPDTLKRDIVINLKDLSPFYRWLQMEKSADTIIEFPMMVGDHFNPYYYYQHFHKKRVLIGYDKNCPPLFKMSGAVSANAYVDEVLNHVNEQQKLKLRNIVEITDVEALKRSGAQYIALHYLFESDLSDVSMPNPNMEAFIKLYKLNFGAPVYSDNCLIVFRIE